MSGYSDAEKFFVTPIPIGTPTANVVQCKDCKYAKPLKNMGWDYSCQLLYSHGVNAEYFCPYGER